MRKFNAEEAIAALELEQLLSDYWHDIDSNGGDNAADFFAEDCVVELGSGSFKGRDGVRKYYKDRLASIRTKETGGVRTTRHTYTNVRTVFKDTDHASLMFVGTSYACAGPPPIKTGSAPVSVSDVRFECRREPDGQWRFVGFYGSLIFSGGDYAALKALTSQ